MRCIAIKTVRILTAIIFISFLFAAGTQASPVWANVAAVVFDNSNDYLTANGVNAKVGGAASISFGGWFYPTDSADGTPGGFYTSSGANLILLFWSATGQIKRFAFLDNAVAYYSDHLFQEERWYHVFATLDQNNNGVLYVNGQQEKTFTSTVRPQSNGLFTIGQDYDAGPVTSNFFNGYADEIRVYNKTLSQAEVQKIMRSESVDTDNGLVGYWKFDEGSGCTSADSSGNNNPATMQPNCSTGDSAGWSKTVKVALTDENPTVQKPIITGTGIDLLYKSEAQVANGFVVKSVEYSINGSNWLPARATDGEFNSDTEKFEFNFQEQHNGNSKDGYLIEIQAKDSGGRVAKHLYFGPFNLKNVTTINNHLEFTIDLNKQRNLLKDRLSHIKIEYASDGTNYQKLLDEIPADFEQVRSSLRNLASHDQPGCDPCQFEDSTMYVSYSDNNSLLRVKTKEEFKKPKTNFSFKAIAANFDGNKQESGTISLEPDSTLSTKTAAQSTATTTLGTTDEAKTVKETKSLPGTKINLKGTEENVGPIAAFVNGIVSLATQIINSIAGLVGAK